VLDFDLANAYGIETRVLKQAVRRNIKRFEGDDFMFEVTGDELSRSQIVTLNRGRGSNIKYKPFAFTELGVAMLSSVLNSDAAIEMNRNIMRAFVFVRNLAFNPPTDQSKELQIGFRELKQSFEDVLTIQNDINEDTRMQLELINESLAELQSKHKGLLTDDSRIRVGFTAPQYRQKDSE
jgi:hypothetical protein